MRGSSGIVDKNFNRQPSSECAGDVLNRRLIVHGQQRSRQCHKELSTPYGFPTRDQPIVAATARITPPEAARGAPMFGKYKAVSASTPKVERGLAGEGDHQVLVTNLWRERAPLAEIVSLRGWRNRVEQNHKQTKDPVGPLT